MHFKMHRTRKKKMTILLLPIITIIIAALAALLLGSPLVNRRIPITQMAWVLAAAPLTAFGTILSLLPRIADGSFLAWQTEWLTTPEITIGFYFDNLAALFALLVTGIGTLVIVYTGYYFKDDPSAWRFLVYILLFMAAMLGLVMSGDVLTLFIFWEGTSITSFLLVAYKYKDKSARRGAFKALFITGGGGIALLIGLLIAGFVAGGTDFATILSNGDVLRGSSLYPLMLLFIGIGAFTKSAQWPAHIWLPSAMSAPTPASAYLHSATMVKAGIYLLARVNPALGETELWFWLLSLAGMMTMLAGAYLGMKQNDLKALLAYSTISQLGILVMLIGQDTEIAFKALVIGVLAHALYKSALFLLAGIVDHETGTRDLRRLGGLRKVMPVSFWLTAVAALSMAGLPPLFGFLAKETLLATAVHPSLPTALAWVFPTAVVIAAAFKLVQSGLLVLDTFTGETRDPALKGKEAPMLMLLAPAIPAVLSLALGILPEPAGLANFFGNAAAAAYGKNVKVSLALWTGLNIPVVLSSVAIGAGIVLTFFRAQLRARWLNFGEALTFNAVFDGLLHGIDQMAGWATRLQRGYLRTYLTVIVVSMVGLVVLFTGIPTVDLSRLNWPVPSLEGELPYLRLIALLVTLCASIATISLKRDLFAIFAVGVLGLGVAVFMLLEPAPDVALVQIVVDILAMVILVLTLVRLPRKQRRAADAISDRREPSDGRMWDTLAAFGGGLVVTFIALTALTTRPRNSALTPFFEENAKKAAGATDIVGAIIVDFRALDTLIEIAVFSMAGIGIYTLVRHAARKYGDAAFALEEMPLQTRAMLNFGLAGERPSPFITTLANLVMPVALVLGITHMIYGHDQPGDGFTAGIIISLGIGFWYLIFGFYGTRQRLGWLHAAKLISAGLLLVVVTGTTAGLMTGSFLGHVNFGELIGLPLPRGFSLSTAFLFEVSICLTVVGSVSYMLSTLGYPVVEEAKKDMEIIAAQDGETAVAPSLGTSPMD